MKKGLINFAVAFAIAAFVIGIAAMIIMHSLSDFFSGSFGKRSETQETKTVDPDTNEGPKKDEGNILSEIEGDSFSILLVMTDYRPDVYDDYMPGMDFGDDSSSDEVGMFENAKRRAGAEKVCLVKCSKETGKYLFVPVPPILKVGTSSGYERVYDVYTDYGIEYLCSKIGAVTGVAVDHYAVINCNDVKSFVASFGAVKCPVPCDIYSDGTFFVSSAVANASKAQDKNSKYEIFLKHYDDLIGPSSMGLLLFHDYTNGVDDEMVICAEYAKGICNNFSEYLKNYPEDTLPLYWSSIKPYLLETDLDDAFFTEHTKLIGKCAEGISKTVNISGYFRQAGDDGDPVYEIDSARTVTSLKPYR